MSRSRGRSLALAGVIVLAACGPQPAPRIPRASTSVDDRWLTPAPAVTPSSGLQALGPGPADLHLVNWSTVPLPVDFCGVSGTLTVNGETRANSERWGKVVLVRDQRIGYGDVNGDGLDEAGIGLECSNGGGTADGQLAFAYVVVASLRAQLQVLGTVTPKQSPPNVHVSFFAQVQLLKGRVVAHERWYRDVDPTCCPSGTATTTWMLQSGRLVAGPPDITS